MTIADWLREEGMQQGMQKGRQEGMLLGEQKGIQKGVQKEKEANMKRLKQMASKLLQTGMDLKTISEVTGIPQSEIKKQN